MMKNLRLGIGLIPDFYWILAVLAKLCKHFSNERKTLQRTKNIFSKSRQKPEKFHLGSLKELDEVLVLFKEASHNCIGRTVIAKVGDHLP